MTVVGITGKAGSGKSLLANVFEYKGAARICLDEVGHSVLHEITDELTKAFGSSVVSEGIVDRRKLSNIVFSSHEKLAVLNKLTHPLIKSRTLEILSGLNSQLAVIEGALLFDIGLADACDKVIWIESSEEIIHKRLETRGMDRDKIERIVSLHRGLEKYRSLCDAVIVNDSTPKDLVQRLFQLLHEWRIA